MVHSPAALWLLLTPALAGQRSAPWYDNTVLELPTHHEEDREGLTRSAATQLDHLELVDGEGAKTVQASELASLPLPALVALHYTAARRHVGAELDLVVPTEEGGRAVTVWWEEAGRARVQVGPEVGALLPPPSATLPGALSMPLVERGATWSPRERAVLAAALERVEPRAHRAIQGQPLMRLPGSVGRGGAASHAIEDGEPHFEFHDDPFLADCCGFVGPASAPVPTSVFVVLHEVGHALVSWPALQLAARLEALASEYEGAYARYEAEYEAYERAVEAYNAAPSTAGLARVEGLQPGVDASGAAVQVLGARVEDLGERLSQLRRESPVMAAWKRVPGHSPGPTPYSRTHVEESFAESYALFHTDPEALRRSRPKVHAWLARGEHLAAAGL